MAQKPGAPLGFWRLDGRPVLGLPGNPVAAMLMAELYARPALRQMMGFRHRFRPVGGQPVALEVDGEDALRRHHQPVDASEDPAIRSAGQGSRHVDLRETVLSEEERGWLNTYHAEVRTRIGPLVGPEALAWLDRACAPI